MVATKKKAPSEDIANVSTLKTHLGRYLKRVRAGGEIIVLDRQLPIAKLISYTGSTEPLVEKGPSLSKAEVVELLKRNDTKGRVRKLSKKSLAYLSDDRGEK